MSHTTSIKGIKIVNIAALQRAVEELNGKGIRMTLLENEIPRAYYQNQEGLGRADYVIKLEDGAYDIGFYKQPDGSYEPRTDFWEHVRTGQKSVSALLGTEASKPEFRDQAKMGKLFQAYAINAAMIEARRTGKMVRRVDNTETGMTKLVLTGF